MAASPPPITITDEATGSRATIQPAAGFNCTSFRPVVAGAAIETVWAEPDFGPHSRPSRSGIPLLFPFAGRLRGQELAFRGRTYRVEGAQLNNGNPIHGFVLNRPWRVTEQATNRLTAEFQASVDDSSLLDQWPVDFRIAVTYAVAGAALSCEVDIANPDERPLPFALGTHPYFRLPLGGGDRAACRITVPAAASWELDGGIPTGKVEPVGANLDLRRGARFGDLGVDAVLTDLHEIGRAHV